MLITRVSRLSHRETTQDIPVTEDQLRAWHQGLPIQQAMPNLTAAQREFILSGITDEEFEGLLSDFG